MTETDKGWSYCIDVVSYLWHGWCIPLSWVYNCDPGDFGDSGDCAPLDSGDIGDFLW